MPPLKIVIPQTTNNEQESGQTRNGKSNSQRSHPALPYVVASSNSNDSNDKETTPGTASPTENVVKSEEKRDTSTTVGDEQVCVSVFLFITKVSSSVCLQELVVCLAFLLSCDMIASGNNCFRDLVQVTREF